jgi:hypothetical protein
MRHIRPTSLTWLAGLMATATGTGALVLPEHGVLPDLARLVAALERLGVIEQPLAPSWMRRIAFAFRFDQPRSSRTLAAVRVP